MTHLSTDCMKRMGMEGIDQRRRSGDHTCEYGCAVHPTPHFVLVVARAFYLPTVYEAQKRGRGKAKTKNSGRHQTRPRAAAATTRTAFVKAA